MTEVKKMKVLELIMDWSLWPRYEANDLDSTNLNQLKEAMKAGVKLPPVIVDKDSLRIVDGFHRVSAAIGVDGDTAEIDVELRQYENDTEIFIESARLNSMQGLKLSPKDKAHVILTLRRKKVPLAKIGDALGMTKEKVQQMLKNRTATTSKGETIPLAAGAMDLAGKRLNSKEEKFARTSNGMLPVVNARLFINALKACDNWPSTYNEAFVCSELMDILTTKEAQINALLEERREVAA